MITSPPSADAVEAAASVLGERARRGAPIGPLTTYRVGGAAALLFTAEDDADLARASGAVQASGLPVLVIGKGSNLLVADAGFPGLAVVLGEGFATVEITGTSVHAGGAAALPVVARRCAAAGLTGFEWAVGVPGSVGGAVRMNAGGHGSDMAACLAGVRVHDLATGEDEAVPTAGLDLAYRHSSVVATQVVVSADIQLRRGDRARSEAELAEIVRWRREHQPGGPNAGSVFTNPPGDSAGRLIELSGAKGLRVGTAAVSTKHANFVQADEGGRADDVRALMVAVQRRVLDHVGVELEPETRLVGFGPEPEQSS